MCFPHRSSFVSQGLHRPRPSTEATTSSSSHLPQASSSLAGAPVSPCRPRPCLVASPQLRATGTPTPRTSTMETPPSPAGLLFIVSRSSGYLHPFPRPRCRLQLRQAAAVASALPAVLLDGAKFIFKRLCTPVSPWACVRRRCQPRLLMLFCVGRQGHQVRLRGFAKYHSDAPSLTTWTAKFLHQ